MGAGLGMSAMRVSVCDADNNLGPEGGAAIGEGIKSCPRLTVLKLERKLRGHAVGGSYWFWRGSACRRQGAVRATRGVLCGGAHD